MDSARPGMWRGSARGARFCTLRRVPDPVLQHGGRGQLQRRSEDRDPAGLAGLVAGEQAVPPLAAVALPANRNVAHWAGHSVEVLSAHLRDVLGRAGRRGAASGDVGTGALGHRA